MFFFKRLSRNGRDPLVGDSRSRVHWTSSNGTVITAIEAVSEKRRYVVGILLFHWLDSRAKMKRCVTDAQPHLNKIDTQVDFAYTI
jgi:hypothetical protein